MAMAMASASASASALAAAAVAYERHVREAQWSADIAKAWDLYRRSGAVSCSAMKLACIYVLGVKPSKFEVRQMLAALTPPKPKPKPKPKVQSKPIPTAEAEAEAKAKAEAEAEAVFASGFSRVQFESALRSRLRVFDADEVVRQQYVALDATARGYLTRDDLTAAIREFAPHLSAAAIELAFAEGDTDRNGKIGFRDFHMLHSHALDPPPIPPSVPVPQPSTTRRTGPHASASASASMGMGGRPVAPPRLPAPDVAHSAVGLQYALPTAAATIPAGPSAAASRGLAPAAAAPSTLAPAASSASSAASAVAAPTLGAADGVPPRLSQQPGTVVTRTVVRVR